MPRKGENIYKRKDGRWEGRYVKSRDQSGKIKYGYVYAKTYREVKNKLCDSKVSNALPNTNTTLNKKVLFSSIALEWLESISSRIKESTRNKYNNILYLYVLPSYQDIRINNITSELIDSYCNELINFGGKDQTGLSPKTVTDILSVIRCILKFAKKKGIEVPCDGSAVQIKQYNRSMRVLSILEQNQLCKHLLEKRNSYNIGILICLFTGLRVGELCALRWEDISFSDQTIFVHQTLQRIQNKADNEAKTKIVITPPKSIFSIRTIPLTEELCSLLAEYKKGDTGYVLTNSDKKFVEPRTMQYQFKKILSLNGIQKANFHSLRHTFATRCIEVGFDIKSLSEILGHATVNITMNRYVHPTLELKKENMEKLSKLLAVK